MNSVSDGCCNHDNMRMRHTYAQRAKREYEMIVSEGIEGRAEAPQEPPTRLCHLFPRPGSAFHSLCFIPLYVFTLALGLNHGHLLDPPAAHVTLCQGWLQLTKAWLLHDSLVFIVRVARGCLKHTSQGIILYYYIEYHNHRTQQINKLYVATYSKLRGKKRAACSELE